jgi:hypothetical protein
MQKQQHLSKRSVIQHIMDLLARSRGFAKKLPKLRLPLMFAILALLSSDKVNLFNDKLVDLMEHLIVIDNHNKTEKHALLAAEAIERMITEEVMDYKVEPDINLTKLFIQYYQLVAKDGLPEENINMMKQRRMLVTPTLDYY